MLYKYISPGHHQQASPNLKDGQTGLVKGVKGAPRIVRVEFGAKNLHAQQGKDKYEEHEQDQKGVDAGNRVHQRLDEVAHGGPVSDTE